MYSAQLETAIDRVVKRWKDMDKKKMFGGVCHLLRGNRRFGISKESLIVRMDKDLAEKSLTGGNVKPFAITGRPMAGWILVEEAGWKGQVNLAKWIAGGKRFALSLPEKKGKKKAKKKTLKEYRQSRTGPSGHPKGMYQEYP